MQSPLIALLVFLAGMVWGSFANVLIARVPDGLQITGRSRCPHCRQQLLARDLIPVLSWFVLGGKCRNCHGPISVLYPVIEITCAVLISITAQWNLGIFELLAWIVFIAIAVPLAVIDFKEMRLPDLLVFPLFLLGVILFSLASINADLAALGRAAASSLLLSASLLVIRWISRGGMGLGDVKLALVTGFFLGYGGWSTLVFGTFAAFFIACIVGLSLIFFKRAGRKTRIPFGPFMLLGAWLAYWITPFIQSSY